MQTIVGQVSSTEVTDMYTGHETLMFVVKDDPRNLDGGKDVLNAALRSVWDCKVRITIEVIDG